MTAIKAFVQRHPVASYFVLTFAISWGGIFILAARTGNPAPSGEAMTLLPFAVLAMLVGPPIASILLTGLVDGRVGLAALFSRLLRWRVGARWYAVALVATPLLVAATLVALMPTSPVFLPGIVAADDKATVLLISIAYGLGAGFFEELGWTGFAVPRLRQRYGGMTTGLIVGFLWGVWHFLTNCWVSGDVSGALSLPLFLPATLFAVAVLPAYRVLMVWVYDHIESLPVAMLMHASLTGSWLIVMPLAISGRPS